jgi:hypothetical protein
LLFASEVGEIVETGDRCFAPATCDFPDTGAAGNGFGDDRLCPYRIVPLLADFDSVTGIRRGGRVKLQDGIGTDAFVDEATVRRQPHADVRRRVTAIATVVAAVDRIKANLQRLRRTKQGIHD